MRPKTSLAAVIVAIFILAAATAPSASAAPPDDACSLLTQAQVTAALGVAVGAPHQTTAIMKTCTCIQADAGLIGGKSVQVILRTADDHDKNKAQMNQANAMAKEKKSGAEHAPTVAPIGGLGDDAYYTTTGSTATLSVKKGLVAEHRTGFLEVHLGADSVMRALDCEPDLCGVIQLQNSVLTRNLDKLLPWSRDGDWLLRLGHS